MLMQMTHGCFLGIILSTSDFKSTAWTATAGGSEQEILSDGIEKQVRLSSQINSSFVHRPKQPNSELA